MANIQIPNDLHESNLTMPQVRDVMKKRKRIAVLEKRIAAWPKKQAAMEAEMRTLQAEEDAVKEGGTDGD